jgi:fido (protein-threonine AMPylation protein)
VRPRLPDYTGFESFRDSDISPYYRSELRRLPPEETWTAINARLLGLLRGIHTRTLRGPVEIDPAQLDRWHAYLFGQDFMGAGRTRRGNVTYPVMIVDGGKATERLRQGPAPELVRGELGRSCQEFATHLESALTGGGYIEMAAGALAAAELYSAVLRIHPYEDGNGRLAFVVLQAALRSQGMHAITFDDLARHDRLLGHALRDEPERDVNPIAGLVVEREASARVAQGAGPQGAYAVLPDGVRELDDDEALAALAHNAMLLALHPDHARRLMEEHGQDAAGRPV